MKAGRRIYYIDVKRDRRDDLFLSITEVKKMQSGEGADLQRGFEKHKIFLYKEDFDKVLNGLKEAIDYIRAQEQGTPAHQRSEVCQEPLTDTEESLSEGLSSEIDIDMEF